MKSRLILAILVSYCMLSAFSADAQVTVNLTYNGDGILVAKTVNGVTTQHLVDDRNPSRLPQVMEERVNGVVQRRYTYGKQRISETQFINGVWTTSFYGYDAEGNVRQLTNAAGVVTDTYDYDAFGNLIHQTGTTPNVYLYRGERYDPDMGLYYMRARWYNPLTGRFMSRDPEEGQPQDPASLHKYLYAGGDPVNALDPTGKAAVSIPFPGSPPAPSQPQAGGGGSAIEYAALVGVIALGTVAAEKAVACAGNTASSTLGLSIGSVTSGAGRRYHCRPNARPNVRRVIRPRERSAMSPTPATRITAGIRIITSGSRIRILVPVSAFGTASTGRPAQPMLLRRRRPIAVLTHPGQLIEV